MNEVNKGCGKKKEEKVLTLCNSKTFVFLVPLIEGDFVAGQ